MLGTDPSAGILAADHVRPAAHSTAALKSLPIVQFVNKTPRFLLQIVHPKAPFIAEIARTSFVVRTNTQDYCKESSLTVALGWPIPSVSLSSHKTRLPTSMNQLSLRLAEQQLAVERTLQGKVQMRPFFCRRWGVNCVCHSHTRRESTRTSSKRLRILRQYVREPL